ncbi:hypothetical protein E6P09_12345 [Haloferax mediterranei ATCC 33500]|uniref:DUF7979 domain-containing protein n=1 Tax=Haloferax mediterranei (strain ATCC 33500 / DSM 1411 / JCM 8866 / NBRC 14739 / NCIMB 2177 / R-4) TaxID=523841 RepID=I3R8J8_HALMT|nr:hypothetical protein [Haloferax mediterranei]AFK20558.1 hypothetical protein HFX_2888 [Haloferax mediterranei ATCC 33500]AHZ23915.1 hypothetical protein BM92_15235 [Haloferax mediterranei ATCC 33500]ELZ98340.1 hypothetical protein C439_16185 [Haloferax mediterranei ATCC 33500]MDX5986687.1 hypothetical protein [Haloferax mediterranei ATCC 33500]QCQ76014.1 hypothetical protein E6P09_12345 [Haloferax mediterranei ATCC 33500]
MSPKLSRRALLGGFAAGSALLSGCLGGLLGSSCTSSYSLEATVVTDPELVDIVTEDFHEHAETVSRLVATAASEGAATYSTYHSIPLDSGDYVEHDGAYYRVERERTETRERIAREVSIEYDRDESPPATGATVFKFDELPEADREAFLATYPSKDFENGDGPRGFSIGGYGHVYPAGADSQLIDAGPVWIRYEGRSFEVTVGETRTVEEETFRYTLEQVGEDRAAFAAFVHEEVVVPLDDLSDAERAVFERAIDEGVDECEPLSDDFAALKERLNEISENRAASYGDQLVEYEGTTYEVELMHAVV